LEEGEPLVNIKTVGEKCECAGAPRTGRGFGEA